MPKKKLIITILIVAAILFLGGLAYLKIWISAIKNTPSKTIFSQEIIDSDKYYTFMGYLTGVDKNKKILSMKINSVDSLTETLSGYENKIYRFQINNQTEIYKFNPSGILTSGQGKQVISFNDLKIGNVVGLTILKAELNNPGDFSVSSVILYQ